MTAFVLALQTAAILPSAAESASAPVLENDYLRISTSGCQTFRIENRSHDTKLFMSTSHGEVRIGDYAGDEWAHEAQLVGRSDDATLRAFSGVSSVPLTIVSTNMQSQRAESFELQVPVKWFCPQVPTKDPQIAVSCVEGGLQFTNPSEHWAVYLVAGWWNEETGYHILGNDFDVKPGGSWLREAREIPANLDLS
ncbi:MAG: hypothetical protein IPJ61_00590 [Tessaracoccus sp.]|uniref:hypothetical protein n=1 Tax=Tessaracoccus sp. TaxID=1971211 RepID=UPI001EC6980B|nr:hypothetical protein [Tessaracoccus sp.]MBK7819593.1 hypothetical protein [Tessaracoccus sp.]